MQGFSSIEGVDELSRAAGSWVIQRRGWQIFEDDRPTVFGVLQGLHKEKPKARGMMYAERGTT